MARCRDGDGCPCVVTGEDPIEVTGEGSADVPYVVGLADAVATSLEVVDSGTINLALTGTGAPGTPYSLTGEVIDGTVTPAANPTLDLVGAKVIDPLSYDTGTREIGLGISDDAGNAVALGTDGKLFVGPPEVDPADLISADADNALVAGTDDKLFVPEPGGGTVTDVWLKALVTTDDPLTVTTMDTATVYDAVIASWLFYMTPRPTPGDLVYILPPGPNSGEDPAAALVIGFGTPHPVWSLRHRNRDHPEPGRGARRVRRGTTSAPWRCPGTARSTTTRSWSWAPAATVAAANRSS